jgi:hypothetical protein
MSATVAFGRVPSNQTSVRVGLAQATADQAQDQVAQTALVVGQVAQQVGQVAQQIGTAVEVAEQAQTAATQAQSTATQAQTTAQAAQSTATQAQTAAELASSRALNAIADAATAQTAAEQAQATADQAQATADQAQATADQALSGGGGGGTSDTWAVRSVVPASADQWLLTKTSQGSVLPAASALAAAWYGSLSSAPGDAYVALIHGRRYAVDLAAASVLPPADGYDTTAAPGGYLGGTLVPSGGVGDTEVGLVAISRSGATVLLETSDGAPLFDEVDLLTDPIYSGQMDSAAVDGRTAYPTPGAVTSGLTPAPASVAFAPFWGNSVLFVGFDLAGGATLGLNIARPGAGDMRMTQPVRMGDSGMILTTSWNEDPSLFGAVFQIDPANSVVEQLPVGDLEIWTKAPDGFLIQTRSFPPGADIPLRLVSSGATFNGTSDTLEFLRGLGPELVPRNYVVSDPNPDPNIRRQDQVAYFAAAYNEALGCKVLLPAGDICVYLFFQELSGLKVERHVLNDLLNVRQVLGNVGSGSENPMKWTAAVYCPERQSVLCLPGTAGAVLEVKGRGATFSASVFAEWSAPPFAFSGMLYRDGVLWLFPSDRGGGVLRIALQG